MEGVLTTLGCVVAAVVLFLIVIASAAIKTHDALLLSLSGTAMIYEVGAHRAVPLTLGPDELTVLYRGTPYQMFAKGETVLVRVIREVEEHHR